MLAILAMRSERVSKPQIAPFCSTPQKEVKDFDGRD
jgi:hypothetical protein